MKNILYSHEVNAASVVVAIGLGDVVLVSTFSVEGELIIIHPSGFVTGAQSVCVGSKKITHKLMSFCLLR